MKISAGFLLLATLLTGCQTMSPAKTARAPKKVLVVTVTSAFRHTVIPTSERILAQLAEKSGAFTIDFIHQPPGKPLPPGKGATAAETNEFKAAEAKWEKEVLAPALEKLSPASLKHYDGVIFDSTTGELPIPDRAGFLAWIKSGGAFIGIHSASDTFHNWPEFLEMIGAEFKQHGAQVSVDCINQDLSSPATRHLGKVWTIPLEEIYQFKKYNREAVHELLVMDKHPNDKRPGHYPVSWERKYGKGRVFYTSLGHRDDMWDADPALKDRKNPVAISQAYQAHVLGGIEWALRLD